MPGEIAMQDKSTMQDPIRILFVCHGNICRSPMAQFVMQDLVDKAGLSDRFVIDSAATHDDVIGWKPHEGTIKKLREVGVSMQNHTARLVESEEYDRWNYIIYMDSENKRYLGRIFPKDDDEKISPLLSWAGRSEDVADPWYTHNFDVTYDDVAEGCSALLEQLIS